MNDFDAIKNVYMAAKRKNKYILDRCTKLIIIPQMTLLDIKRIIENPQNNDEIQFAFTYLELAKTIINDGNLLCMEDVVKPFETKAFEYLSGAIRIQNKGMCNEILNITNGNAEKILLSEFENRDRLRKYAKGLIGDDINSYNHFLVELFIITVFELNAVSRKIIEMEYNPNFAKLIETNQGKEKLNEYYQMAYQYIRESCLALFIKEINIASNNSGNDVNLQNAILYMDEYKNYIKNLIASRKK